MNLGQETDVQAKFVDCIANRAPKLLGTEEKQEYCSSVAYGGAGNAGKVLNGAGVAVAAPSAVPVTISAGPSAARAPWPVPISSSSAYGYSDNSSLPSSSSPFVMEPHTSSQVPYVQGTKGRYDNASVSNLRGSQGAQRIAFQESQISGVSPRQKLFGRHGAEHTLNHSFNNGRGCAW